MRGFGWASGVTRMNGRSRRVLAFVSLGLGLLLVLLSFLLLYARANVYQEGGFARNAAEALENDAVAAFVSKALVEQIVENADEDLIAGQSVLEAVMPFVVSSSAFQPIFRRAAAQAHRALFDPDSRKGKSVVLDLADIGIVLSAVLQSRYPNLATDVPQKIRDAVVNTVTRGPAVRFVERAQSLSWLAFALPVLAVGVLALALLAAQDRRRMLAQIGVGAAGVALLVWIASVIGEEATLNRIVDPEVRDPVEGVIDAYLGDIPAWCLVLGGAGALLAAAAASAVSVNELNARLLRGWRAASNTPTGEWARTIRAAILVAIGALILFQRDVALDVFAAVVAFYLVVVGLVELVRQAERFSTRGVAEPASGRFRLAPTIVGGVAVAGIVAAVVVALTGSPGTSAASAPETRGCNGHVELCDRPLDEVVFATAHNAMSAASEGFISPNQARGLVDQLDAGYRAFLIDAYLGALGDKGRINTDLTDYNRDPIVAQIGEEGLAAAERLAGKIQPGQAPAGPTSVYLCHVLCELGASDMVTVMTAVRAWLDEHPNEVLIFFIEDRGPTFEQIEDVFAQSGLLDELYTVAPGGPWPTLREMIDSKRRILVMAENGGRPGTGYQNGFTLTQETPYDIKTVADFEAPENCAPNRGGTAGSLFLLNSFAEVYPPKPSLARKVNAYDFLLDRARRCQEIRDKLPNLVAVDFYDRGDVVDVVDTLNGVG